MKKQDSPLSRFRIPNTLTAAICIAVGLASVSSKANDQAPETGKRRFAEQRSEAIQASRSKGSISPLQAEFMTLLAQDFETPQAKREAIQAWRSEKGPALEAERAQRSALKKPQRDANFEKMRQLRANQIVHAKNAGRIGKKEAHS